MDEDEPPFNNGKEDSAGGVWLNGLKSRQAVEEETGQGQGSIPLSIDVPPQSSEDNAIDTPADTDGVGTDGVHTDGVDPQLIAMKKAAGVATAAAEADMKGEERVSIPSVKEIATKNVPILSAAKLSRDPPVLPPPVEVHPKPPQPQP